MVQGTQALAAVGNQPVNHVAPEKFTIPKINFVNGESGHKQRWVQINIPF